MATFSEKVGYGFGDMSSSTFWKIFTAYLPFFYAQVFHLSLAATGTLMLVARIWDAVSDPMMGIISDRTQTRWGKYRPYLLWMAIPFAVAGVLLFSVPDMGETGRTIWAYVTYLLMMTVYTGINVPYGSMLAVMTDKSEEKTVFSSFRMFFAYGGSFIILFGWEPLCKYVADALGKTYTDPEPWQYSMIVVGLYCAALFVLTFLMTKEHIKTAPKKSSIASDLGTLLNNAPWWILLGGVLFFNFFGAIRYAVIPFFFATLIAADAHVSILSWDVLFYSGLFLGVGEVANMIGVACTPVITKYIGKKSTYLFSLIGLAVFSIAFFFVPTSGSSAFLAMIVLQLLVNICSGFIAPLVWSMYADVSDYAEWKFKTASTGLIFSSSSMAQKFGGAIGGAAVMWFLAGFGFDTTPGAVQGDLAITGLRLLMSWIPAAVALIAAVFIMVYPLTTKRMNEIAVALRVQREETND